MSSARARPARTVDELVAVEWDPDELFGAGATGAASGAEPGEPGAAAPATAAAEPGCDPALQAEIERRVAEAHAAGFEEGREQGEAAEAARLRTAVEAAESALEAMLAGEQRWRGTIEENVCALAIAAARQVIGRELKGDAGAVVELVRSALAEFPLDQPLRVRVSPQDIERISAAGAQPSADAPTAERQTRWLADPMIEPGGCLVEGRERIVDGRVDSALERIYRRLTHTHA